MSRFIGVLTLPRSGSSMVAGMLHHAGVNMGDKLAGVSPYNEKGIYEHVPFYELNHAITYHFDQRGLWDYDTIQRFQSAQLSIGELRTRYRTEAWRLESELYGQKEPLLAVAWNHVHWVIPGDKRLIVVNRRWDHIIDSAMQVRQHIAAMKELTQAHIEAMYTFVRGYINKIVQITQYPVLHVQYERILEDPVTETRRIVDFAFNGLSLDADYEAALAVVEPALNHHGAVPA
jgi:hypothetical protein